jgi:hypothetical protein
MKRAGLILTALAVLAVAGCAKQAAPAPPTAGGKASGWEIRYTAIIALARRGSDKIKDHLDTLADMLDEQQQRANATEPAVAGNISGTLKAIVELHRRRPEMDLSALQPAIDKLEQSSNPVIRIEAGKTKLVLANP